MYTSCPTTFTAFSCELMCYYYNKKKEVIIILINLYYIIVGWRTLSNELCKWSICVCEN